MLSLLGLSLLFGLRHGFDADHLAAIDGIARLHAGAGRDRLARLSGVLFSTGHGAVVLVAALALHGTSTAIPQALDGVGAAISIAILLALGGLNAWQAVRPDRPVADHPLLRFALRGPLIRSPLGGLAVGSLFALSFDTVTLAAWFGSASATRGATGGGLLVSLAGAFVLGMVLCDGLNGLWVAHLVRRSASFAASARRAFAGAVALVSFAVGGIGIARWQSPRADAWLSAHGAAVGAAVLVTVLAAFLVARRASTTEKAVDVSIRRGAVR